MTVSRYLSSDGAPVMLLASLLIIPPMTVLVMIFTDPVAWQQNRYAIMVFLGILIVGGSVTVLVGVKLQIRAIQNAVRRKDFRRATVFKAQVSPPLVVIQLRGDNFLERFPFVLPANRRSRMIRAGDVLRFPVLKSFRPPLSKPIPLEALFDPEELKELTADARKEDV